MYAYASIPIEYFDMFFVKYKQNNLKFLKRNTNESFCSNY